MSATSASIRDLGVADLSRGLAAGTFSSEEVARELLSALAAQDRYGAFLATHEEHTLAQARRADALRAAGQGGPLTGVPVAHKDIFVTDFERSGLPSTAGSKMLAGYASPFDASVVALLGDGSRDGRLPGAGMVTLGKLNCDEFAMGSANENSAYGPARNPWDTNRVPGGSSGGSAAAVAARLVPAATGTDTGGSIRQPAAFCGVTGIKPTYGTCSRYGMIAFASSLDQAGPMARSAEDCALLLSAMSGFDERDSTSAQRPPQDFHAQMLAPRAQAEPGKPLKGLRIGIPSEWRLVVPDFRPEADLRYRTGGVDADVQVAIEGALRELEKLGATLVDVSLPRTELAIPVYYIIAPAEASSNLSRFDGVKFGHRAAQYADLLDMYKKTRAQGFGPEVKRRIMIGTYVLSHGYYDAYYLQAQKLRRMIADDFQACFQQCDVIAGPVAPTVAWALGQTDKDPVADYLADIFTLPASLAGLPGMSVPAGFGAGGLPVGLQLIGNYFQEGTLLHAAHALQQATDTHLRAPAGL
ncbi:MAG: Asp-tRNA(Asn)/Glu-tRNA(Gln) amidotransferase subunit GatA [Betaproteobacteria bacterium]|jgi:aspartyl-tRNA(Asn)/glutamyl-tRNA(Gln) amidotransferase subunit A